MDAVIFTPSDFVAVFNQTVSYAYPSVVVEGEVSNFRIAKNKWVYFDIKDESASLRVFGAVYQLTHALEDGMLIKLTARPELHPLYNFSLQLTHAEPKGEGSIKKSFDLLFQRLQAEGLFEDGRKRQLPYPPAVVGLITSSESAAYGDFIKVLAARWPLTKIRLKDVKVQGSEAADEVCQALQYFAAEADPVEVIVVIRGGGSADDLLAFQDEKLTRAIAASRLPTLVAIGHERDVSLAELAADMRASTPSNAAELLAPQAQDIIQANKAHLDGVKKTLLAGIAEERRLAKETVFSIQAGFKRLLADERRQLAGFKTVLSAFNPELVLKRGFALVYQNGTVVKSAAQLAGNSDITLRFHDGEKPARVIGLK